MLLDLHFAYTPYPGVSILWYLAPATSFFSNNLSEGRMRSCLLDSWVSLGHFPCARKPAVLRIACQYILALHIVAVSPPQPPLCASSPLWGGLMNAGLRLPPLHCCYLGPYDFYRRAFADSSWRLPSASLCTVARGPLSHTRAFLARPSPLQLNIVVGELLGLLPTLRQQHVALRLWLGRDHPSNLCVVPDVLRPDGGSSCT